jgi:hypothetical protein
MGELSDQTFELKAKIVYRCWGKRFEAEGMKQF